MHSPLLISLVLFLVACCLPALEFSHSGASNSIDWSISALLVGWSGIFAGVFGWYANLFWLLGILLSLFRKKMLAVISGAIAIAIACTSFSIIGRELPGDESNVTKMTVIRLLPGCYVWLASLAALPLTALLQKSKPR